MKTLLKISCVLAIALFVSMSAKAQGTEPGTVTVDVPEHLALIMEKAAVALTFDQYGSTSVMSDKAELKIDANVNWNFSIDAAEAFLVNTTFSTAKIPVGAITYESWDGVVRTLKTTGDVDTNYGDHDKSMFFTLHEELMASNGNPMAGLYQVNVTYKLSKKN